MDKNIEKKQHAQLLYITQGKSHAEIAAEVGVSERTVFTWVHQYAWDKLRLAAYQAPVSIANNLCEEIAELQQNIATRDAGLRFPTPQESITMQRMISCLDKMKKYPSLSQNMQVLESFKNYIKPLDKDFSKTLGNYTNRYLSSAAQNGFVPYQLEYGVDAAPPLAPYYDEEEIASDTPSASTWHPDDPINYTIPGLHHARPYLIPLMNICYDQLVEDQQRAEAMAEYYEQHCSTTDTNPEMVSSPNHGSKTPAPQQAGEVVSIECNIENGQDDPVNTSTSSQPQAEASGSKTETQQPQTVSPKSPRNENAQPATVGKVVPTGKPYISPRLEDILSELSRSGTEDDSVDDSDVDDSGNEVVAPEVSGSKTEVDPIENTDISNNETTAIPAAMSGLPAGASMSLSDNMDGCKPGVPSIVPPGIMMRETAGTERERHTIEQWEAYIRSSVTGNGPAK